MTIRHTSVKAPGQMLFAVADWNADHTNVGPLNIGANNLIVDTNTLFVDASSNLVGIGAAPTDYKLEVTGTQGKFRINPDRGATGDVRAGVIIDASKGTNKNLNIASDIQGEVGATVTGVAYTPGTGWHSMWEFANVASGKPNLLLVRSGGNVGINDVTPDSKLHVHTPATEGKETVKIEQDDVDQAFIDFAGTSGAGTSFNINTTEYNTFYRMAMVEISGTKEWIKVYSSS